MAAGRAPPGQQPHRGRDSDGRQRHPDQPGRGYVPARRPPPPLPDGPSSKATTPGGRSGRPTTRTPPPPEPSCPTGQAAPGRSHASSSGSAPTVLGKRTRLSRHWPARSATPWLVESNQPPVVGVTGHQAPPLANTLLAELSRRRGFHLGHGQRPPVAGALGRRPQQVRLPAGSGSVPTLAEPGTGRPNLVGRMPVAAGGRR